MLATGPHIIVWAICALATAGVIVRPLRWPEAIWACLGPLLLMSLRLVTPAAAGAAALRGLDVYLFLAGMMLLSETARREGLFDFVAAAAVNHAAGDPRRLFLLIYGVGAAITAFLSNDATAVVLTPAVYAAARKAEVDPLPFLLICAFVANAASFVLPISNPANLVLYGDHTPPLLRWLGAWTALIGIALTAVVLMTVSALNIPLGAPTCLMGLLTTAVVLVRRREGPWATLKGVSWSILPLVAGLFVMVQALQDTGVIAALARLVSTVLRQAPATGPWALGGMLAVACNLMNNLPAGLIASSTIAQAHPSGRAGDALLIGVDLGPNLSVTGSLATILWLTAIRREGEAVGFWRFLRIGALVMPPALLTALAARLLWAR